MSYFVIDGLVFSKLCHSLYNFVGIDIIAFGILKMHFGRICMESA